MNPDFITPFEAGVKDERYSDTKLQRVIEIRRESSQRQLTGEKELAQSKSTPTMVCAQASDRSINIKLTSVRNTGWWQQIVKRNEKKQVIQISSQKTPGGKFAEYGGKVD